MTLKEIVKKFQPASRKDFIKKNLNNLFLFKLYSPYFFFFLLFLIIYLFSFNQFSNFKTQKNNSLNETLASDEFINLKEYIYKNLQSPYREFDYIIQNNDTIEKILNKFDVEKKEIQYVINELKNKKLSNIYTGRKVRLVLKKTKENKNTIINILYPVSNTLKKEIRKNNNNFDIKKI